MLKNFDDILDLPVETQKGIQLGKVDGAIIDIDSQSIYQYSVKPSGITNIFEKELLIHRDQVINITKEKMIVEDGTYEAKESRKGFAKNKVRLQTETATTALKRD